MSILYSVGAMISNNEKIYKGILDFYPDRCILYTNTRTIDEFYYNLEQVHFSKGKKEVSFLGLYTKEKSYIQIEYLGRKSECYIVDENGIDQIIQALKGNVHASSKESLKCINDYDQDVLKLFLENPYRLLGIASNSTELQAIEIFEKIKKLDRLHAIDSYKTDFEIAGFDKVERNLPLCQNALSTIKDISNKWFWFNSSETCQKWQTQSYHQPTFNNIAEFSYDKFLARYIYLLVFDNKIQRRNDWHTIFSFYQYIVGERHAEKLREKLNTKESILYTDEELINNFSNIIFTPVDILLDKEGIDALLSFYRSIRTDRYYTLKEYKRNIAGKITQWFIQQEKNLWVQIEKYIGIGDLDDDEVYRVWLLAQSYDESVQSVLPNALAALTREPLRIEMIKASYIKVMQQVMELLLAGDNKVEACKYANYLYKYADNNTKIKILSIFDMEEIEGDKDCI